MDAPFIYGKLAKGLKFTNRQKELDELLNNLKYGTNTILLSPRRWGKSSLVEKAALEIEKLDSDIRIVKIDLFNIRSESAFYKEITEKVLAATTGKISEIGDAIREFFRKLIPKVSFLPGADLEFSISIDSQEAKKEPDEILDLAENIAKSKNLKIRICIDEFQNIGYFDDPLAFQKKLRAHWQKHENVSYILYGSKRHMLLEVFASPSMPFYNFGSMMFLEKISQKDWTDFIVKQFHESGKSITADLAADIAGKAECHSYYVQQLAQLCWLRTKKEATKEIIEESFHALIMQLSLLFQNITDTLSTTQVNFLHAVLNREEQLSSKTVISAYHLGTSANVSRIKKALIDREIIDQQKGEIEMLDPVYKAWLTQIYFKKTPSRLKPE
ncbi:MAG: AAA family ATPase [Bacteroidales bacterium]